MSQSTLLVMAIALLSAAVNVMPQAQRPNLVATIERVRDAATDSSMSLRIAITMSPGWHIGATTPGAVGVPTRLSWRLPPGWHLIDESWPTPNHEIVGRDTAFTYSGSLVVVASAARERTARRASIQVVLSYVICREICIPGRVTLTYDE